MSFHINILYYLFPFYWKAGFELNMVMLNIGPILVLNVFIPAPRVLYDNRLTLFIRAEKYSYASQTSISFFTSWKISFITHRVIKYKDVGLLKGKLDIHFNFKSFNPSIKLNGMTKIKIVLGWTGDKNIIIRVQKAILVC